MSFGFHYITAVEANDGGITVSAGSESYFADSTGKWIKAPPAEVLAEVRKASAALSKAAPASKAKSKKG